MSTYKTHYTRWCESKNIPKYLLDELHSITSEKEIEERFYRYLEFGTAGLRGLLGAGTNRMNIFTIRRASYGFAKYLLAEKDNVKDKGIAIAFDSRHFSKQFAHEAAATFASLGIKAYIYPEIRPTPMLSYAVRKLGAIGGIVITASHNPPNYNGFKVYDEEGCQISPEVADRILHYINQIEDELSLSTADYKDCLQNKTIIEISSEIEQSYYDQVVTLSQNYEHVRNQVHKVQIVYTPLHGTGTNPVQNTLQSFGFTNNLHIVQEQAIPDPNFHTVSSPNPEDPNAFTMAIQLAQSVNADAILATDPDADRLGVAVKDSAGNYQMLNGNQLGALLLHYVLNQKYKNNVLPENGIVFKTIVTSDICNKICSFYGMKLEETLTGFKFIGEKIHQYEKTGEFQFLFGYEESYGYLIGDFVRDKDAIQAAFLTVEMIISYRDKGLTLLDALDEIYLKFGYYAEDQLSLTYAGKDGMEIIEQMMSTLRLQPIESIENFQVVEVKDYLNGIDGLPIANVLKFMFADESWIAFRPSGTEPKIKCYFSTVGSTKTEVDQKLSTLKSYIQQTYFQ